MSGHAPRLSKASFDPLMNPGDEVAVAAPEEDAPLLSASSSGNKQLPTDDLQRLALEPKPAAAEEEDVPAQTMSEFLSGSGGSISIGSAAASALFDELDPAAAAAAKSAAAKKKQLFDDDDDESDSDIELSDAQREAKQKKRAEERAAAIAKQNAEAAAAQSDSPPDSPVSPSDVSVRSGSVGAGAAGLTVPAAAGGSKRAGSKDLFNDADSSDKPGQRGLGSVFIPQGAAEYRTEQDKARTEAVDPALLEERNDDDLQRLSGEPVSSSSANGHAAGAADSALAAALAAADAQSASGAAAAAEVDDLDDLFATVKPTASAASIGVDPNAANFDLNAYLASQKGTAAAGGAVKSTGASLFDDDDD
jgi:hypothetical protein